MTPAPSLPQEVVVMAAEALAAQAVLSRLQRQEEDIRWLWAEVQRLRDQQLHDPDRCPVEGDPCATREVAQLRAENRDLRRRLSSLRRGLAVGAGLPGPPECAAVQLPPTQVQGNDVQEEESDPGGQNSSSRWAGDRGMEQLQRVYATAFPDARRVKAWEKGQEEARHLDHRKIGKEQELFFFHELSPGSCFFLPRGAFVYNTLIDFLREEYRQRGYAEVLSPNLYSAQLWEASGHRPLYGENMFTVEAEKETLALKPMNCPAHCLMFAHRPRSWREMPLRLADFGVLHRNEPPETLSGLAQARRFQQDDAHIFCTEEQIGDEIQGCLQFLQSVYATFGFSFQLNLSTRPERFLGEADTWDTAEKQLKNSLEAFGRPWTISPGEGAFYGPKIDAKIQDAAGSYHQCATIQLDLQLPVRFNLTYVSKNGEEKARPVIIHRAILGSVERMVAILSENYAGRWPFWLSPRQVMVIPAGPACGDSALQVSRRLSEEGFTADTDLDHSRALNKKIQRAQLAQYNFIWVVRDKEKAVSVHTRDNKIHGEMPVASAMERLRVLRESRALSAEEDF